MLGLGCDSVEKSQHTSIVINPIPYYELPLELFFIIGYSLMRKFLSPLEVL
jgi:hypothetical protein